MKHANRTAFTARRLGIAAATLMALGLAACDQSDDQRTAGQKLDAAVDQVQAKADAAGERIAEGAAQVKQDAAQVADEASRVVADAAITAAINAELARDDQLSALKSNVDTDGGRVALRGTAPDEAARVRAGGSSAAFGASSAAPGSDGAPKGPLITEFGCGRANCSGQGEGGELCGCGGRRFDVANGS